MGWFSDMLFGERATLDTDKISDYMQPTQNAISGFQGANQSLMDMAQNFQQTGQDFMDPYSTMNMQSRNLVGQQSLELGAQNVSNIGKLMAQGGVNKGIAASNQNIAQNQIGRGTEENMFNFMLQNRELGANTLGSGIGMYGQGVSNVGVGAGLQQGMDENMANAYLQQINAQNQRRANNQGMAAGVLGGILGGINWG